MYLPADGDSVYCDEVKGLVSSVFQGINATVFAYGGFCTTMKSFSLPCTQLTDPASEKAASSDNATVREQLLAWRGASSN